jgi:hypothetical protein
MKVNEDMNERLGVSGSIYYCPRPCIEGVTCFIEAMAILNRPNNTDIQTDSTSFPTRTNVSELQYHTFPSKQKPDRQTFQTTTPKLQKEQKLS